MKTLLTSFLTFTALFLSACGANTVIGSGNIARETREVRDFQKINLSIPAKLILSEAESESLEISAEDNLLPYIQTSIENGILSIEVEPQMTGIHPTKPIEIRVSAREISAITINGSGTVEAETLSAADLKLEINGTGKIQIETVKTSRLNAKINGAGEMALAQVEAEGTVLNIDGSGQYLVAGQSADVQVSIDGSGKVNASGLECERARAAINGTGTISLWASDELDAYIAGTGSITYRGKATVSKSIIGTGSIRHE